MAQTQTHRRQKPTPKTIVRWDVRNWSRPLRYWQQHSHLDLTGRAALELGANRGGLSLWLASLGADVVCSDIQQPGPDVRAFHAQYNASERIAYARPTPRPCPSTTTASTWSSSNPSWEPCDNTTARKK